MPAIYRYANEAPRLGPLVHVTVEYQTQGGALGSWSRWVHFRTSDEDGDDLTRALNFASEHVRKFKRVGRVHAGSAYPFNGAR
jgi:hypothetical protein